MPSDRRQGIQSGRVGRDDLLGPLAAQWLDAIDLPAGNQPVLRVDAKPDDIAVFAINSVFIIIAKGDLSRRGAGDIEVDRSAADGSQDKGILARQRPGDDYLLGAVLGSQVLRAGDLVEGRAARQVPGAGPVRVDDRADGAGADVNDDA